VGVVRDGFTNFVQIFVKRVTKGLVCGVAVFLVEFAKLPSVKIALSHAPYLNINLYILLWYARNVL